VKRPIAAALLTGSLALAGCGTEMWSAVAEDPHCRETPRHIRSYGMPQFLMPHPTRSQGDSPCHTHKTLSEQAQAPGR